MTSSTDSQATIDTPREMSQAFKDTVAYYKREANLAEKRMNKHVANWLKAKHHLEKLQHREPTGWFAQQSLELNEHFLLDITNKALNEVVEKVAKCQRAIQRYDDKATMETQVSIFFSDMYVSEMMKFRGVDCEGPELN